MHMTVRRIEPASYATLAERPNVWVLVVRLLLSSPASEDFGPGCGPYAAADQHAIQHLLDGRDGRYYFDFKEVAPHTSSGMAWRWSR